VPGESTNCEPPYAVHASTYTTMQGGTSPCAKTASAVSMNGWRYAVRLAHIVTCPV
jgi:hypothetical protein